MSTTESIVANAFGGPEVLAVSEEELPAPAPGQVLVEMRAIGVNPIDYKLYSGALGANESRLPLHLGAEGSGVVLEVGADAAGPAGPISVGDEVIAYPGEGAYTRKLVLPADYVFPRPEALSWEQSAGLMVAGTTASEAIVVTGVVGGETLLIHGAAGGVGSLAVQLAVAKGVTVIGTAAESNHEYLRGLGAIPVTYGDGLESRVRALAPNGVDAAFDTAGTDEAVDVSLALVADRKRIVTIVAFGRAQQDGFVAIGAGNPDTPRIRKAARLGLVEAAADGKLDVVVAKTFPLTEAARAHAELQRPHPRGKFVLIP
ncbi:NADP-dependent oxidoreductase [Rhodococcus sp. UNC363MFTsu5.1]|uniref:NADP-dependent oxidoreductase n=1 Tax=Rhodococcus sp. UNC363MFTsu5.1 TaxID=1449069 RepID=UPI00055F8EA5|nr:NADP-dependent oxidoreductase [Rhodococcus sp. UNC363MFTsu5.1]